MGEAEYRRVRSGKLLNGCAGRLLDVIGHMAIGHFDELRDAESASQSHAI